MYTKVPMLRGRLYLLVSVVCVALEVRAVGGVKLKSTVRGVEMIGAEDPRFLGLAYHITPQLDQPPFARIRPLLVILQNQSDRAIVGFSIIWEMKLPGGTIDGQAYQRLQPHRLSGPSRPQYGRISEAGEIPPNGLVLLSPVFSLDYGPTALEFSWTDPVADARLDQFLGAAEVSLTLDSVVYDDYTYSGEGSDLLERFIAYLAAKHVIAAEIKGERDNTAEGLVSAASAPSVRRDEFAAQFDNAWRAVPDVWNMGAPLYARRHWSNSVSDK